MPITPSCYSARRVPLATTTCATLPVGNCFLYWSQQSFGFSVFSAFWQSISLSLYRTCRFSSETNELLLISWTSQKERDLELAARIGQSLLEQNSDLKNRLDQLENDYLTANETVSFVVFLSFIAARDGVCGFLLRRNSSERVPLYFLFHRFLSCSYVIRPMIKFLSY